MSCKSALYSGNSNSQSLSIGSVISFGSPIRRFGNNISIDGGNPQIEGIGYYDIDANFTITPTANGSVSVTLYKDGTIIPNATATVTGTTTDTLSITIPAMVRQTCCCQSPITAILSGVACTINNAAIVIKKI